MRQFPINLFLIALFASSCNSPNDDKRPPLYEGMGEYQMEIDSSSEEAKRYFNQGLILMYGYNYPEATRAFREAAKCDPESGICHWAEAVSLGECIENPGDRWCVEAYQAMSEANRLAASSSLKEQAVIQTITDRYEKEGQKYEIFDLHFVDQMRKLQEQYPEDPDIAAIFSNCCMQRTNMEDPSGNANEIVAVLEESMEQYPNHPGLNHFYIHAMEGVGTPKKALGAAERLDGAVPASGHLQHMPAHIYYRYGRYHDASAANQRGIDADRYLFEAGAVKDPAFAGFYLHNHYYLFRSLTMEGRSEDALAASNRVLQRLQDGDLPSNPYLNNVYQSIPYLLLARYGKWEELDQREAPRKNLPFTRGAWHYAVGQSALKKGDPNGAKQHLGQLKQIIQTYSEKKDDPAYSRNLSDILIMAYLDLEGQIAASSGRIDLQIQNLQNALSIQESMYLGMLPWYMPIRHALGAAYLEAGKPVEAEKVYLADLDENPVNGWALQGLILSLEAQNKHQELFLRNRQLDEAWKYADIQLVSSRF